MNWGYEIEERGSDREQEPEQAAKSSRTASVDTRDRNAREDREPDRRAIETGTKPRLSDRVIEKWSGLSERERETLSEFTPPNGTCKVVSAVNRRRRLPVHYRVQIAGSSDTPSRDHSLQR